MEAMCESMTEEKEDGVGDVGGGRGKRKEKGGRAQLK